MILQFQSKKEKKSASVEIVDVWVVYIEPSPPSLLNLKASW